MCSKEELLRQLLIKVSFMTDEDVQKMLEYAKRELDETAEKEKMCIRDRYTRAVR